MQDDTTQQISSAITYHMRQAFIHNVVARGRRGEQGSGGQKSPSGVQGQSPGGGQGTKPPEATVTM